MHGVATATRALAGRGRRVHLHPDDEQLHRPDDDHVDDEDDPVHHYDRLADLSLALGCFGPADNEARQQYEQDVKSPHCQERAPPGLPDDLLFARGLRLLRTWEKVHCSTPIARWRPPAAQDGVDHKTDPSAEGSAPADPAGHGQGRVQHHCVMAAHAARDLHVGDDHSRKQRQCRDAHQADAHVERVPLLMRWTGIGCFSFSIPHLVPLFHRQSLSEGRQSSLFCHLPSKNKHREDCLIEILYQKRALRGFNMAGR